MVKNRILQSLATLDRGGAEAMIMSLYRNIDREIFQFDFVVNNRDIPYAFEAEILELGGRIFTTPKFNGKNIREYRREMKQLFQSFPEWRIVHIHNTSSAMLFLDLAKKQHIVTIAHAHFEQDSKDLKSYAQRLLRTPLKNKADYLFACSEKAGAYVFHKTRRPVQVIKNAIETEKYTFDEEIRKRKRAELGIQTEIVIGHVGRMGSEKNHFYLLEIFKDYHTTNSNSVLFLIGDGVLRSQLEAWVSRHQLTEAVKFIGMRTDVNELMQAMDVYVFPSVFEGVPVVLIEAQAAGLPILASNRITEAVKITDLVSFKSIDANPSHWAKVIDEVLIFFRENTSQKIIQAGYDVKQTAAELQKIYLSIIEGGD